ncbi:MAG: caspase family protein [Clostridiaceae bacterium]|jgi:hypothetical protein|nr:caspase family protein [Clostridiaceae bacterium]
MEDIKAILVGVSKYLISGCDPLPLCINDLVAMKSALVRGLNVKPDNLFVCGETGIVTKDQLSSLMRNVLKITNEEDTFLFYFSGHGGKNCLALSDGLIDLQKLIDEIASIKSKNKIIVLDSCHSGGFLIDSIPKMDINDMVEKFAGYGYAVLASCGAEENSGFHENRRISLFTSFVCDAITSRFLIKEGKKSLESINEAIFHYADIYNKKREQICQQPIFRSNIGGTIFFNVEEYHPYKAEEVYEETDRYIIYRVEPVHHARMKRYAVKVILRFHSSPEQIAEIASEIKSKVLYCEVYRNEISQEYYSGKAANIIWCFFGYDEDDMVDGNYAYRTTWVDEQQNKEWWYRISRDTIIISDIHIQSHSSYEIIKSLKENNIDKNELIQTTRLYTANMITAAERLINTYREHLNNTIDEEQLIESVIPINAEISKWYFKQMNLPIPPIELKEWAQVHINLSCAIHDLSIFYDRRNTEIWEANSRKWLMKNAIKQYEIELEKLKRADRSIQEITAENQINR